VPVLDEIAAGMGLGGRLELHQRAADGLAGLHPGRSAAVAAGDGADVGLVGEVDPGVLEAFGIAGRVAWLELDLTALLAMEPEIPQWQPVSRYPSSDIDLAFVLADEVPAADLEAAMSDAAGPLLADISLFDVYRGPGIEAGERSLAYRLRLQASDRTLTDAEVAAVRERIIAAATARGAVLRG
jgi:phenylalanyl-tRNA synthetase beta chain